MCKIPGSYSENRHEVLKPSLESNVSSPSVTRSEEKEFIVDPRASLEMVTESDLTPEEQETIIQKSKDPSVIMTANGTTRTTEEAAVQVCSSSMIGRITRGTFTGQLVRRNRFFV